MQRYHALLMPLLLAALSYAGVDGYGKLEEYRAQQAAPASAEVTVNVASMPEQSDAITEKEVQAMINKAIAAHQASKQYHEFDQ